MMASNLLARWRSSNNPSASIYETIQQDDEDLDADASDHDPKELDLEDGFHDIERGQADHAESTSPRLRPSFQSPRAKTRADKRRGRPKWLAKGQRLLEFEDADDDVPASLLIEGTEVGLGPGSISLPPPPSLMNEPRRDGMPGHLQHRASGNARSIPFTQSAQSGAPPATRRLAGMAGADPREKALYRWTNVVNLDNFLQDLYMYYLNNGFWSILLRRMFALITIAFVVGFSLFLTQCIDYRSIKDSTKLSEVLVNRCTTRMGFGANALLWAMTFTWICKSFQYVRDIQQLRHIHDFYLHLLNVPDVEIQSIEWQEIVSRLMALRDSNPTVSSNASAKSRKWATTQSKQRMDAHDIANRLMRKDNYVIAMVNKDILDMTLPIPYLRNRQLFTRTLEWNLNWCVLDFVFNNKGQVRPTFLKEAHRKDLAEALQRRFLFAAIANFVIAPFLIVFILIQNFFTYFNEYQKNPSSIGSRQYNVFAEWKFREFNELWHLFKKRINMSHPFASRYIDQFPKDKTVQMARFVTFISGALISVLGVATILDQENFLSFEITHGRTTIFYLGLFGGIWAVARGLIPEDTIVHDPAFSMQEVIEFTHYQPSHWQGRLHTVEVKNEFEQLYQMKIVVFVEEILSMVFTPFVLWFSLPKCSERIIDFIREFTVHVDGIGYVCSFAEFKLRKPNEQSAENVQRSQLGLRDAQPHDPRDDYFASKDHKLEQSYWGFMNDYARNPKADVRFHYRNVRRRLQMPPPVPGLPSPTLQAGLGSQDPATAGRPTSASSAHRPTGTPQFQAQSTGSPLQSLLLDAHHQPSSSGFGGPPLAKSRTSGIQARSIRRTVEPPADVAEEEEEMPGNDSEQPNANRSDLGSWKYEDEGETSADEDDDTDKHEMGVLGLIRQLQKTQGDGTRTASGI